MLLCCNTHSAGGPWDATGRVRCLCWGYCCQSCSAPLVHEVHATAALLLHTVLLVAAGGEECNGTSRFSLRERLGTYPFSSSFWVKCYFLTDFEMKCNSLHLCELVAGERRHPVLLKFGSSFSVHLLSSSF